MEIIILGLLMLNHATIYELKQIIGKNLKPISSNSTGSIQVAIKKLREKGMIIYKEKVENSVNKKVYSITEMGERYFEESLSTPMLYKEKNMELSKLFFMGFLDKKKQIESIDNYIKELEKELNSLEQIGDSLNPRYEFGQEYMDNLRQSSNKPEILTEERVHSIATFQYATLDLGLDKLKFEVEWFRKFNEKLKMEDVENEE